MEDECQEFKNIINQNKVVVWGGPHCNSCRKVKLLLKSYDYSFHEENIFSSEQLEECLFKSTNFPYIPQVFLNQKFMGSFLEVKQALESGVFQEIFQDKKTI